MTQHATRTDPADLGVPMLPGDGSEPVGPEDALGPGPKRGDYTGRIGDSYHPHEIRPGTVAAEPVVIDPAELDSIEPVTDNDVAQAEREAAEAEQLAAALEERVVSGDDSVTPEQIDSQRSLSRFARLRVAATQRKAARAKAAARMREVVELRSQVVDQAAGGPASLTGVASALNAVDKAVAKFLDVAEQHNTWHADMRAKAGQLVGGEVVDGTMYRYGEDDAAGLAYADRSSFREPAHLTANGERIEDVDTATLLVAAVYQAAAKYPHLRMEGGFGDELLAYLLGGQTYTDPAGMFAQTREHLTTAAAAAKAKR